MRFPFNGDATYPRLLLKGAMMTAPNKRLRSQPHAIVTDMIKNLRPWGKNHMACPQAQGSLPWPLRALCPVFRDKAPRNT